MIARALVYPGFISAGGERERALSDSAFVLLKNPRNQLSARSPAAVCLYGGWNVSNFVTCFFFKALQAVRASHMTRSIAV